MKNLLKICREFALPDLKGNVLLLVNIAAEMLLTDGRSLPFKTSGMSKVKKNRISAILRDAFDWSTADASILGRLYESLIDVDGEKSKQSARRRSGSFYTPGNITSYLVRAAYDARSGDSLKSEPVFLDPACGGGAFLLDAFRFLRGKFPGKSAEYIATKMIRGIDTDPSAVRIARLSLWIDAGLRENGWSELETRIYVGDSIRSAVAGEIRKAPIIVTNPPYRNVKRGIPDDVAEFCKENYRTAIGQWDLVSIFIELTLKYLLIEGGAAGFVVPSPVLTAENYESVRKIILEKILTAFGPVGAVFDEPGVEASLLVVGNSPSRPGKAQTVSVDKNGSILEKSGIPRVIFRKLPFSIFSHLAKPCDIRRINDKAIAGEHVPLGDIATITRGLEIGKNHPCILKMPTDKASIPVLTGSTVGEFCTNPQHYIDMDSASGEIDLKNPAMWEGKCQLLLRRVAPFPIAAVSTPASLALNTLYVLRGDDFDAHALCAIINSEIFRDLFRQFFAFDERLFPYIRASQAGLMPVPKAALMDRPLSRMSVKLHSIYRSDKKKTAAQSATAVKDRINAIVREYYFG